MNNNLNFYFENLLKNDGASEYLINQVQKDLDFILPPDYISIIKEFNGGEGEIGNNSWLFLFPIEELLEVNQDYVLLMEQIPDYFLFGKDAADTGYAFHKVVKSIHSFGLMSNFDTDPIEFCGNSFFDFVKYLYEK